MLFVCRRLQDDHCVVVGPVMVSLLHIVTIDIVIATLFVQSSVGQTPWRSGSHGLYPCPLLMHPTLQVLYLCYRWTHWAGLAMIHWCQWWTPLAAERCLLKAGDSCTDRRVKAKIQSTVKEFCWPSKGLL